MTSGPTARSSGRAVSGFVHVQAGGAPLNCHVRRHMRFRLTSIADEGLSAELTPALIALEDWLNVSLCDGE